MTAHLSKNDEQHIAITVTEADVHPTAGTKS